VLDLVNQSHRVDIRSRDNLPTYHCYPFSKSPCGCKICQDDFAIQGKQGFIELVFLAGLAGNVEFKFGHINLIGKLPSNP
jgi:hypothetical protein